MAFQLLNTFSEKGQVKHYIIIIFLFLFVTYTII